MARVRIKIEGFRETIAAWRSFDADMKSKTPINNALKAALKPIADTASAKAPRDTGELASLILIKGPRGAPKADPSKAEYGRVLRATGSRDAAAASMRAIRRAEKAARGGGKPPVMMYTGPDNSQREAIPQEFGSPYGFHPFMRPAWDENKMQSLDIIRDEFKVQVDKASKRAAKKAASVIARARKR